jgi:hypothetical protein
VTDRAVDIYQRHLDVSTRFVVAGDAEGYTVHAQLPFVFRTAMGVEVAETAADMAHDIRRVHEAIKALGATDYFRIARSARFLDDSTVEGFHVTHALRGAVPVFEPYESRMILRLVNGAWKTCFAEHELAHPVLSGRKPHALTGVFSSRWTGADARPAADPAEALPIYRATVGRIASFATDGDFENWIALYTTPHTVHYDTGDDQVETMEDARRYPTIREIEKRTKT